MTDGGMVAAAFLALLKVEGRGPAAEEDGFLGVLVKGLFAENGATVTAVDVARRSALFGDGSDAAETLQVGRGGKAFALGSHAGQ